MSDYRRWMAILVLLFLAACGTSLDVPTATPAAPAASPVPVAMATASPVPTAMPSPTPPPTATAGPTPTPIPSPTPTPTGVLAAVVDVVSLVDVRPVRGPDSEQALPNMAVYQGGEVWAREESTARLGIENGMVRVAPNTILTLQQPDDDTLRINLQDGQIWLDVEDLEPGKTIEVETPDVVTSVRGARLSVRTLLDGGTVVSVAGGAAAVTARGQTVTLSAGRQTTVLRRETPSPPEPISLEEELRWGMAQGGGLDVVLPVARLAGTLIGPGSVNAPALSVDGSLFAAHVFRSMEPERSEPLVYDIEHGVTVTDLVPVDARYLTLSPDGEWLAYKRWVDLGYWLCFARRDGAEPLCLDEPETLYGEAQWSPDGAWAVFYGGVKELGGTFQLFRVHLDDGQVTALTTDPNTNNLSPAWSPDGSQIAYVSGPARWESGRLAAGELWLMAADGSRARRLMLKTGYGPPQWSPDGRMLAVAGYDAGLWLVDAAGGIEAVPGLESTLVGDVAWSPTPDGWPLWLRPWQDGQKGNTLYYYTGGGQPPVALAHATWGPVWSRDGSVAAFGQWTGRPDDDPSTGTTGVYLLRLAPSFYP